MTAWWFQPLWKYERQLGWLFPVNGKVKVMFESPPTSSYIIVISHKIPSNPIEPPFSLWFPYGYRQPDNQSVHRLHPIRFFNPHLPDGRGRPRCLSMGFFLSRWHRSTSIMVMTAMWMLVHTMWCPDIIWLVVSNPLKNISQLGWLFPIYGNIKNVPNHQPVMLDYWSH